MVVTKRGVNENRIRELFSRLWKLRIINVALIVRNAAEKYCAYNYDPYDDSNHCGVVRMKLLGCYMSDVCNSTDHWFGNSLRNFNGCTLNVGTFDAKPFAMVQVVDNITVFVGLEAEIMKISANKLNFSMNYLTPPGNQKWGVFEPGNTTGLMGMLERSEVDVGFGVTGLNLNLSEHLRSSTPSIISQLTMAIPPRNPYTSLEKLFLPFTVGSWILIVASILVIWCFSLLLLYWWNYSLFENKHSVVYITWVILMGGPGNSVQKHSSRIYMISLVLNAFIVRNMYQSQLFTYMRSIDSYASNLNSYDDINGAGLFYYMYPSAKPFFIDNPSVKGRIRIVDEENVDWDEILYNISLHRTNGVMALALESITYYVKRRGQEGMVYVSRDTGVSYYIAFHFPKASALKELFDELINRFYAGGLIVHWLRKYRDNPDTWVNQKKEKEPTPLQLHQVSGGFYLWMSLMCLATVIFVIELCNGESRVATTFQADLINSVAKQNSDWMVISFEDLPTLERRPAFYNVFLVQDYASLCNIVSQMDYHSYQFHGYYTVFLEQSDNDAVSRVMEKLWNSSIINAVVICRESDEEYVAYSYHPYRAGKCGMVKPIEQGRLHTDEEWISSTSVWFGDRIANFNGCPLKVGTVEVKPYSMSRREDNETVYFGLEMLIAEAIAEKLQFSLDCKTPQDNVRWGILHPTNSTGLVGLIQRREVDFGFGSLGYSLSRHIYLKMGTPNYLTQMIMAIPPQRPYTSLEKLFQPFTIDAWICIAVGYLIFGVTTLLLAKFNPNAISETIHYPLFTLWVLLMGGSAGKFQLSSSRTFIIGFIVNALVVRTLYQAGMFKRLQASASLASDLNTISAINKAGLMFIMYRSTTQFYKDNPMVPAR
ncbi:uncharacterized protein LOC126572756 [Anopheles aquasalis]|uniref:uncharacterized protein LOC126572756 n=1 Tax=Anopheles aquasalis TaxID=42839 RepID=UPI00215B1AA1|nr:uncharacterized protein LOC126572756 [Anopheles aquasalis]